MSQPVYDLATMTYSQKRQCPSDHSLPPKCFKSSHYETVDLDSIDEIEPEHENDLQLLGLSDTLTYDPSLGLDLNLLKTSNDPEIVAILRVFNRRFRILETRIKRIEDVVTSLACVEGKSKYAYRWIKGAEGAGVYKLPQNI